MMDEPEKLMTRYLLGELSESEQSALEEKYFADPQVFNQVLKTESELVDAYVRGRLSNKARARFEQFYLAHPERSERVRFAAALATRLDRIEETATAAEQPVQRASWWRRLFAPRGGRKPKLRLSIALATLLIIIGGIWLLVESRRRQRESAKIPPVNGVQPRREPAQQNEDERKRAEELAAEQKHVEPGPQQIPQPTPAPTLSPAPRSVSLALVVGGVRGSDNSRMPILIIPPDATQARLQLNLRENDYPGYDASLQRVAGGEIFSQKGVKPGRAKTGASFVFTVSARQLASGDYVLTLRGVNPNGEVDELSKSLFRVEKR